MPPMLPPFGRSGSGGGSQLPPRLQNVHQQEPPEINCSPQKRPPGCPPHLSSGGRGIRLNWHRQPPGQTYGTSRDRRLEQEDAALVSGVALSGAASTSRLEARRQQLEALFSPLNRSVGQVPPGHELDPDEFPALPSRKQEKLSTKLNIRGDQGSTDTDMLAPSGCPMPTTALPLTTLPPTTMPPPSLVTPPHTLSVPPPPAPLPMTGPPPSPYLFPPPPPPPQCQTTGTCVNHAVPFCPYLVVPHVDHSVPVNVNAICSADPSGADLPIKDTATLRFFYNLGLEYYRLCMLFQLQQQQYGTTTYLGSTQQMSAAAGPLPPPEGAVYVTDIEDIHGTSSAKELCKDSDKSNGQANAEDVSQKAAAATTTTTTTCLATVADEVCDELNTLPPAHVKEVADCDGKSDTKAKDGDSSSQSDDTMGDSGCVSDVSSGNEGFLASEECDVALLPCMFTDRQTDNSDGQSNPANDSQSDSCSQHSNVSVLSSSGSECGSGLLYQKPCYVPLKTNIVPKLLKPLKDIPPRFQKILSCNPAIRYEQFEGRPIMRHPFYHNHRPKSVIVSANNINDVPTQHSFNPYADTFIPRQNGPADQLNTSSTNSTSCTSSKILSYSHRGDAMPSECCSSGTSEGAYNGTAEVSAPGAMQPWPNPPPHTEVANNMAAPTYTIHIHSAGCTIEPVLRGCTVTNHCVSTTSSSASSPGCYAVSNALPAPPSIPPASNHSFDVVGATSAVASAAPPPPPPPPPGGIVYYCQQQQHQPDTYNQNYSTAPYPMPAPTGPQYVYGTPTTYHSYDNYTYA